MNNLIEKTKDLITGKQTPVTSDVAKMIALTGKVCTVEQRTNEFISEINELIMAKSRLSCFRILVELPKDLHSSSDKIKEDFKSRGFSIHDLNPIVVGTFIINWE